MRPLVQNLIIGLTLYLTLYGVLFTGTLITELRKPTHGNEQVLVRANGELAACALKLEQDQLAKNGQLVALDTCNAKTMELTDLLHKALCVSYHHMPPADRAEHGISDAFRHEHCKVMTNKYDALGWHEPKPDAP